MIFLLAAVLAVPLAKRLKLGAVLGYLLAGVIIGWVQLVIGVAAVILVIAAGASAPDPEPYPDGPTTTTYEPFAPGTYAN